jgi:hypothetical protein
MADGHVVYDEAGDVLPRMVREVLDAKQRHDAEGHLFAYGVAYVRLALNGRGWVDAEVLDPADVVVLRGRDRRLSRREALAEFEGLGPVSGREVRPCPSLTQASCPTSLSRSFRSPPRSERRC